MFVSSKLFRSLFFFPGGIIMHNVGKPLTLRSNLFDPKGPMVGIRNMTFIFLVQIWYPDFVLLWQWFWCFLLFTHFCKQFFVVIIFQTFIDPFKFQTVLPFVLPKQKNCWRPTLKRMKIKAQNRPLMSSKFVSFNDLDTGNETKPLVSSGSDVVTHSLWGDDPTWRMAYFSTKVGWARNCQQVMPSWSTEFFLHPIQC